MLPSRGNFLGELRLGRRLTTTAQVTITGLMFFIGLTFVISGPILNQNGLRGVFAILLAGVIFGMTLVSLVELLPGSGERGSTYILIHETLGGISAFLAGWGMLAGAVAMGMVFVSEAAVLVVDILNLRFHPNIVALGILGILILIQLGQLFPRRIRRRSVILILLILIVFMVLSTLPNLNISLYSRSPSIGLDSFLRSITWIMAGYLGFEALLESRRQIRDPGQRLPRATWGTLIISTLLLVLIVGIGAGIPFSSSENPSSITSLIKQASLLPDQAIDFLVFIALLIGTNISIMTAVRQVDSFSREGAFPEILKKVRPPFRMPFGLFIVLFPLIIPLLVWVPRWRVLEFAAGMFLLGMILLNAAAIYSRYKEPDRRRSFVVPFSPLFPTLAISINLVLLFTLPLNTFVLSGVWFVIGVIFYVLYARRKQAVAQEGEVVFGKRRVEDQKTGYRILVPIHKSEERRLAFRLSVSLARQLKGEVIPVQIIPVADPLAIEEGRRLAKERNTLFQWSTRLASDEGVPVFPITRLARSVPEGIIDTAIEEDCDLVVLTWAIKPDKLQTRLSSILEPVAKGVQCDVAVLAYHPEQSGIKDPDSTVVFKPTRLLVPTAGGPHAPLAIRLALLLTKEHDSIVHAVYVTSPDASPKGKEIGEKRIQETINAMRDQEVELSGENGQGPSVEEIPIEGLVIPAHGVVEGIVEAGKECDLVLIGASEESIIDQVLFGNIPEEVARKSSTPVLMVKRYLGLPRFWLQRTWDTLFKALPTVREEEQIEIYRRLHRGARPSVDFFTMIGLSALIATFGLIQDSAAVIIGAMLVAPLFTPLMALSLSIVQGNVRLLRLAVDSTLKGISLAIGLAVLMSLLTPLKPTTPQILARTQPSLMDLGVALASGMAGAYAISRKEVAAALPGVAIAAALVPPLGVVGIGLAQGNLTIVGGAIVLIATNLIAIALAGAITLLLLGFRPRRGAEENIRRGLATAIVLFLIVSIPLILVFVQSVRTSRTEKLIQDTLQDQLEVVPGIELVNLEDIEIEQTREEMIVTVQVYASNQISHRLAENLSQQLSSLVDKSVRTRLVTLNIVEPEQEP